MTVSPTLTVIVSEPPQCLANDSPVPVLTNGTTKKTQLLDSARTVLV